MALLDANGVAINVGDTVMITGTVTAVNPGSTHYREVTLQISHPVPGLPKNDIALTPDLGGTVNVRSEFNQHNPGGDSLLKCSNLVLNH